MNIELEYCRRIIIISILLKFDKEFNTVQTINELL